MPRYSDTLRARRFTLTEEHPHRSSLLVHCIRRHSPPSRGAEDLRHDTGPRVERALEVLHRLHRLVLRAGREGVAAGGQHRRVDLGVGIELADGGGLELQTGAQLGRALELRLGVAAPRAEALSQVEEPAIVRVEGELPRKRLRQAQLGGGGVERLTLALSVLRRGEQLVEPAAVVVASRLEGRSAEGEHALQQRQRGGEVGARAGEEALGRLLEARLEREGAQVPLGQVARGRLPGPARQLDERADQVGPAGELEQCRGRLVVAAGSGEARRILEPRGCDAAGLLLQHRLRALGGQRQPLLPQRQCRPRAARVPDRSGRLEQRCGRGAVERDGARVHALRRSPDLEHSLELRQQRLGLVAELRVRRAIVARGRQALRQLRVVNVLVHRLRRLLRQVERLPHRLQHQRRLRAVVPTDRLRESRTIERRRHLVDDSARARLAQSERGEQLVC
mmetsp:Transcript_25643/g.82282  ORF Transcript_25643/g.82282 Transcript_25643/m.82282 type:complete len:451 (+) Transcript_25643:190-1542(+)